RHVHGHQAHPRGQRPREGDPHGRARRDRGSLSAPGQAARRVHRDPAGELQGVRPGGALSLQASVSVTAPSRDPRHAEARLRAPPQRLAEGPRGLPRACARSAALAVGARARLLPAGGDRAPRGAPRVRFDAILRRSSVDGTDAPSLASPAPRGPPTVTPRRLSLVQLAASGLHHSGLLAPVSRAVGYARRTPTFPILKYHRVNDDADPFFSALPTAVFEQQMRHVARNYRVLPVEELVVRLER